MEKIIKAITHLSVIPIREKPSDTSEMTSQLLFGEEIIILDRYKEWALCETIPDKYQGWIDTKQVTILNQDAGVGIKSSFLSSKTAWATSSKESVLLSFGSPLPDYEKGTFYFGTIKYKLEKPYSTSKQKLKQEEIINLAKLFLGVPYLWGGKSFFGIDCSGFVQLIFRVSGYELPRDSGDQSKIGQNVDFIHESQPGDLAFFANEEEKITHVGIILENGHIIHASGQVRIDTIDHEGIFNKEKGKYTHKLRLIKRIF